MTVELRKVGGLLHAGPCMESPLVLQAGDSAGDGG